MDNKKFGFSLGIFEVLTPKIIKAKREESKQYETYAIGVYTDDFVEKEFGTACIKKQEQRMEIAEQLDGVDFVFSVSTRDANIVKEEVAKAYGTYLQQKRQLEEMKKYKVGIAIGSYDTIHSGHIENMTLAKQQCDKLAVVVKSDERIQKNKNKTPMQSTAKRAGILKELKSVDHVFYMNLETTRAELIEQISDFYEVNVEEMAVFLGSDLKDKEEQHKEEWQGVNLVFTERDEEKMEVVSSSYFKKQAEEIGKKIEEFEDLENSSFR